MGGYLIVREREGDQAEGGGIGEGRDFLGGRGHGGG